LIWTPSDAQYNMKLTLYALIAILSAKKLEDPNLHPKTY
jgi:hypothetical protein